MVDLRKIPGALVSPAEAAALSLAPPASLSAGAFFDRFTPSEAVAIWAAAKSADPAMIPIGVGLMQGLARGTINLLSPATKEWLDQLVAAGILTRDRADAVLST